MNWKMLLAVIGLCAVAVVSANRIGYKAGQDSIRREVELAELQGYKAAANSLLEASARANASLIQIGARYHEFTQNYKNLSDFDCYADDDRMQHIFNIYRTPPISW